MPILNCSRSQIHWQLRSKRVLICVAEYKYDKRSFVVVRLSKPIVPLTVSIYLMLQLQNVVQRWLFCIQLAAESLRRWILSKIPKPPANECPECKLSRVNRNETIPLLYEFNDSDDRV